MDGLVITYKGIEQTAAQEIKELLHADATPGETVVRFPVKDMLDLGALCYRAQSVAKVMLLLDHFRFKDEAGIIDRVKAIDFSAFLTENATFRVRCMRVGEHSFDSLDIEQGIGEALAERHGCKADMAGPDVPVYAYVYGQECSIGIDFAGIDLSKRHYRIFAPNDQLKATTAYAMLRIAGFGEKSSLLDPFCGSGTLLIEAALFASRFPINHYSKDQLAFRRFPCLKGTDFDAFFAKLDAEIRSPKMRLVGFDALLKNVAATQKNAKIAGINKQLDVSKIDVTWLDAKYSKGELDLIVTCPPIMTKLNEKAVGKAYKELFYQAEFVLKKTGKVVLATPVPEAFAKPATEYGFTETGRAIVMQGKQAVYILTFTR